MAAKTILSAPWYRRARIPLARLARASLALSCLGGAAGGAVAAEPLRVYAAGSLVDVLKEEIAAAHLDGMQVTTSFGPAGLLGRRLLDGDSADLFLSADVQAPEALVRAGRAQMLVPFARNGMCVIARADTGITAANLLDRLLSPAVRVATSTPGDDPGGDYAFAVFRRAEEVRPGAGAVLRDKALKLLGSPATMRPSEGKSPGASVFLQERADALLYYCSAAPRVLAEAPGLTSTLLPPSLSVSVIYAMAVMSARSDALRLALFIVSSEGQAILTKHGFSSSAGP